MSDELERRLTEWASEYAGSRYEHHGWPGRSWLHTMMQYGGRGPEATRRTTLGTPADEVEQAVQALERAKDGFKPGRVLRCEYWRPNDAEGHKLLALRAIGLPMSRTGYYDHLGRARFHVAGWLRLPVSEEIAA